MIKVTFYQVFMPIGFFPWVPGALLVMRVPSSVEYIEKLTNARDSKLGRSVLAALEVRNLTARKLGMFLVWDYIGAHVFGSILSRLKFMVCQTRSSPRSIR